MAKTIITDEQIDPESPVTSELMTALRDNAEYARIGYAAVSGSTQDLDLTQGQTFDGGTLTADTELTFSNLPAEAKWSYIVRLSGLPEGFSELAQFSNTATSDEGKTCWSRDGRFMYSIEDVSPFGVFQFQAAKPFELAGMFYTGNTLDFSAQIGSVPAFVLNDDGTKLYISENATDRVYQYTMSTAYDISTATYDSVFLSHAAQDAVIDGVQWSDDGTTLYLGRLAIYEYTCSTPYNIGTGSFSQSFNPPSPSSLDDFTFTRDGTILAIAKQDDLYVYELSTAWDTTTAALLGSLISKLPGTTYSIQFTPDGSRLIHTNTAGSLTEFLVTYSGTLTLPASVQNLSDVFGLTSVNFIEFYTNDSGATVQILDQTRGI